MKVFIEREILISAINTVSKAVMAKSPNPIFEGILVEAEGDKLIFTGNDREIAIEYSISTKILENGSLIVNAKMIGDIVRKLPNAPIYIETDDKGILIIRCQEIEYNILTLKNEGFPKIDKFSSETSISLSEKKLKQIIKQTIFCTSTNESRPVLTGILFKLSKGMMTVTAVDGFRLALKNINIIEENLEGEYIIPAKTLNELLKILRDEDEQSIKICFSDNQVLFETGEYIMLSRLIEGTFIDYQKIIPNESVINAEVTASEFISCIERSALIINADDTKTPLRIKIEGEDITFTCISKLGKMQESIKTNHTGGEIEIGFNHKYLLDAFKNTDCEEVTVGLNNSLSPCVIRPMKDDDFIFLILPVRLA